MTSMKWRLKLYVYIQKCSMLQQADIKLWKTDGRTYRKWRSDSYESLYFCWECKQPSQTEVPSSLLSLADLRKIPPEGHGHIPVLRAFKAFYYNNRNYKNRYDLDTECLCHYVQMNAIINGNLRVTYITAADVKCFLAMSKCHHTNLFVINKINKILKLLTKKVNISKTFYFTRSIHMPFFY